MPPRKKMNGADRKNAILEAAMPLFAHKGYHGTSVRDIARAANVSEALLYKHFPSKKKLHEEIHKFTANIVTFARDEMETLDPGAETLVKHVYLFFKLILFEVPGLGKEQAWHERLLFRSLLGDNAFASSHFNRIQKISAGHFTRCIKAAIQDGDITVSAAALENGLWLSHHLAMALNLCHLSDKPAFPYKGSKHDLAHQAMLFCLRGMGMTEDAIEKYFKPQKLERLYQKIVRS